MNYKKFIVIIVIAFLGIFIIVSCSRKGRSIGADNVIAVLAETEEYALLEKALKEVFEREIYTPAIETIFTLKHITLDQFDQYRRWKSMIIISTLNSKGEILPLIKTMLKEEDLEKIKTKKSFAFNKVEPWAHNQQLLVLVSTDIPALKEKLVQNKDPLFQIMDKFLDDRITREMFAKSEQLGLEEKMLEQYGWKVRIQHDFQVIFEDSGKSFVMLQRKLPVRNFMVYWMDTDDPSLITREWIIQKRNELGVNFPEADTVDERYTNSSEVEFVGRRALKLDGLWYTTVKGGGPFRSYTFYDENDGRIYMIDYSIFAPDREKEPLLRQMEIMTRTFQIRSNIK